MFDIQNVRKDFPILSRTINGNPLVYLDNAATSQKPRHVINALSDFYLHHNANIHRGVHTLGDEATDFYDGARVKVSKFIGAYKTEEIVFTKNSTEALNLVAFGWGARNIEEGDVVLMSMSEHNSNILPWREVCRAKNASLEMFELDEHGEIVWESFKKQLNSKVKVVVLSHASNVLGTIFPIKEISNLAQKVGAKVVVDGSQAIPHMPVNVQSLGCDFYAFSAHKMLGPMGVGVLWGRKELLEKTTPVFFGGGMVLEFDLNNPAWHKIPERFEAGTPDVGGVVAFGVAIEYLNSIGMENVRAHELELTKYALEKLSAVEGIQILGPEKADKRAGLVSFVLKDIHSHDIASVLNTEGIAVRSGMHCAMNLHKQLNIPASTRASFYLYNTKEEIDKLIEGISKARKILS